jgi:hypothetical protein
VTVCRLQRQRLRLHGVLQAGLERDRAAAVRKVLREPRRGLRQLQSDHDAVHDPDQ